FYDGAGRQIQTQTVGAVVNGTLQNVVVDYQYNNVGRLVKQSVPRLIANGTPVFASQNLTTATTTTYDVLGRTLSVDQPSTQPNENAVTYEYGDFTTTVKDPYLTPTVTTMDVWGRTTSVNAPEGPDVSYEYDILGRLKKATRAGLDTIINYDAAGRKLDMADPDMGFWTYKYDALGNLKVQKDARNQYICLYYDSLNRLTGKHYRADDLCPTSPTYDVSFGYDDAANGTKGKGRRTSMNDGSGSTNWKYDERGRVLSEVKIINSAPSPFTTSWTYNSADLPVKMTYPVEGEELNGEDVTYGYNSDGSLNSVISNTGGTYLASTQYDEAGRITSMNYGANIIQKTFTYFPWNTPIQGGLLDKAITTRSDNFILQSFEYDYDKNANIETILDHSNSDQKLCFSYDTLNRLTKSTTYEDGSKGCTTQLGQGNYSETYSYDNTTGNLSVKAGVSYTYDPAHPHAVKSLSNNNTYQYDPNGNMTQRIVGALTFNLAYDAENRLTSVNGNGTPPPTATPTATQTPVGPTATSTPTITATQTPTVTNTPGGPTATFTSTPTPSADLIFADAFESGNLSAWTSSATDLGDLSASASAALAGIWGMQAVLDDINTIYVTDDSPNAEPRYRARFYFDPNSITMASGDAHFIFKGFSGASTDLFQVEFRQSAGNYEIRVRVLNDASAWGNSNWFIISDAPHYIEV
ncbi:MAG: hypothetical protein L0287_16340, partial [Anaerolineae bacterium]|nr:hypothetical protein [Anaerolineae bacterium]